MAYDRDSNFLKDNPVCCYVWHCLKSIGHENVHCLESLFRVAFIPSQEMAAVQEQDRQNKGVGQSQEGAVGPGVGQIGVGTAGHGVQLNELNKCRQSLFIVADEIS